MEPASKTEAEKRIGAKTCKTRQMTRQILCVSLGVLLLAGANSSDAFARGFGYFGGGYAHPMARSGWLPRYARAPGRPPSDGSRWPGRGHWPMWGRHPVRTYHPYPIYGGYSGEPDMPATTKAMSSQRAAQLPPPRPHFAETPPHSDSAVPVAGEHRFVPNEVLFTVKGSSQLTERIARQHGLTLVSAQHLALLGKTLNRYRIGPNRSVPQVVRELQSEQQIAWVQPNYIFKLEGADTGNQSLATAQYALERMHFIEAHRVTEGARSLVAVIDSGIDASHPDLAGSIADRVDLVNDKSSTDTHGTAVASVIGAHGALTGAAPDAKILAIRAFSESASSPGAEGTTAHVIEALNWAFEHKARAVNMSFAGPNDPLLADALASAHRNGMILIAAAGNEGADAPPAYPAADPNVIAVTATDRDDRLFASANHGGYICLAASGSDIIVAAPSHSYQFSSGTSLAAAQISGLVALLLSERPNLTADEVRKILTDTAEDLGSQGRDPEFGAGLGDAAKAVAVAEAMHDRQLAKSEAR